jgi:dihydroorotate dehydrogenase electron transfer subunit
MSDLAMHRTASPVSVGDRGLGSSTQLPHAYRIVEVRVENPTVRTFVLDGKMEADPGQFVMAWLPGIDEKPFSLSGADPIALTVARVGPFTTAMHELSAGDRLWLRGPYGRGFVVCDGPLMVICGGCGAAPLHYLAQVARRLEREVHVVLGARTAEGLFFQDRYAALGCAVHIATDDGSAGHRGTSIDLAVSLLDERKVAIQTLYACGPEPMLDAVRHVAKERGLPCQLSHEAYMRCGLGVCGSCAREGRLVCRDGPVFEG